MFNSNNFDDIITLNDTDKNHFKLLLSEHFINFSDISDFPNNKGLYFLFYQNILIYIGSASTTGRTIKIRCQQYLQKGNGGESFRGKIELLKKISSDEAIQFIKENISAKFIDCNNLDKDNILQLEQVAICCYQPLLNFILKKFNYEMLKTTNLSH